jgi:tRNA-splicing ligase RtcB (3'-phosphate/5'-hydroxy nucleic acid ligase)
MLHSGSRALGRHVCDHFNRIAQEMNARYHSEVPREAQLAYLSTHTEEGQAYLAWMRLCMAYALENRRRMLDAAVDALFTTVRGVAPEHRFMITEAVDTHHNYADVEHHFGEDVYIHRKGAVRARQGEMVIIPGWIETSNYIGRGQGNRASCDLDSNDAVRRLLDFLVAAGEALVRGTPAPSLLPAQQGAGRLQWFFW